MEDLVNINRINVKVLDSIEELLRIRFSAGVYVSQPTEDNARALVDAVDILSTTIEDLKFNLSVLVKQANGTIDEIVGRETDNGIALD